MRRFAIAVLLTAFSASTVLADNLLSLTLSGGPAFPERGMKNLFGTGYGGTGLFEFSLNENVGLLIAGGYFRWQFDNTRVNAAVLAAGGESGTGIIGQFRAFPALIGARLTFTGESVRPYFGVLGGAFILHRGISAPGYFSNTWTEPAMSVDAGLMVVLSKSLSLDIGGTYTAFSNADDRLEPSDVLGVKLASANTAAYLGVQAGVRVGF